jgi:hypothetical protein
MSIKMVWMASFTDEHGAYLRNSGIGSRQIIVKSKPVLFDTDQELNLLVSDQSKEGRRSRASESSSLVVHVPSQGR